MNYPNINVVSFGIRNISSSEISFLKKNKKRIKIYWAKDKSRWNLSEFKKIIKNKKVYLTFDVDGLDLSIMPATGTPEPGGLFWDETMNIIKIAAKSSHIVGADVNELSPIKGFDSYNFLTAKLVYKIISSKSGLGLGTFIGKTLLERMKANVKFDKCPKTNGAMVTIKWQTKDLLTI